MNKKNIILIGNSGCGKSSITIKLSSIFKKKIFDIDNIIENKFNININKIFIKYGENFFRNEELKILKEIYNLNNIIVSTGAGIITKRENINLLKNLGIIIYIKSNINECINRIINFSNRPLLKYNYDINEFKKREKIYENISTIIVDSKKKNIEELSLDIKNIINNYIKYL